MLPNPVVLACEQALAAMPPPARLAIGSDARPLTVLTSSYFSESGGDDLVRHASAAYDLSILALIDNYLDDEGPGVGCRLRYCRATLRSKASPVIRRGHPAIMSQWNEGCSARMNLTKF